MMKSDLIEFKLTISVGDTNVTKFVTASKGEHAKKLNEIFIKAVRDIEDLIDLEKLFNNEEKDTVIKPTKEKKTKNAKDNS